MKKSEVERKIKVKKRGNSLGIGFFKCALRIFGLKGTYGFLYIVCIYYLLFDAEAVSGAMAYIKRRFPDSAKSIKYWHIYKLFISQGKHLIDRYLIASSTDKFNIVFNGYDDFVSMAKEKNKGFILLTAHVGTWQVAIDTLKNLGKTVYLVMRHEDNPALQESLRVSSTSSHVKIISPEEYLGGVIEMVKVLEEGNILSIMGDRRYGFEATEINFMGDSAWFPYGAFMLAASVGCPVVPLLTAKTSTYEHSINVTDIYRPVYVKNDKKRDQLKEWVQKFALLLEGYVAKYPYQCFLFHDIWGDNENTKDLSSR